MGANSSNTKYNENVCNTPPKHNVQLLFDPRSPSDAIARTPIQIDSQLPAASARSYNHVMPPVIEPDLSVNEENDENHPDEQKANQDENEPKYSVDVEPTLDPATASTNNNLVTNDNEETPPYQS